MQPAGFSILETLYEGRKNIIYRALDKDKNRVILKVLKKTVLQTKVPFIKKTTTAIKMLNKNN